LNPPILNDAEFITFVLVLVRVSMIMTLAPIFGSEILPAQVKILLMLVTALLLTSVLRVKATIYPDDILAYVPMVLRELAIGLAMALLVRLVFEAVSFAGQFMGYMMGFAIANVIDPQSGAQNSVIAQFMYILALIVFLTLNGHHIIIKALVESFELAPPGDFSTPAFVMHEMLTAMGRMFVIAVKIGAPVLAVLFCAKVSMGIVAKTVPQMNVLFVGMPLYIILGIVVLGLSLSLFIPILSRAMFEADRSLGIVLHAF
jgi:flagellar biosynthetic protein FliR